MRPALFLLACLLASCNTDTTTRTVETYTVPPEASGEGGEQSDTQRNDAERSIADYFAANYGVTLTALDCPPLPDAGTVTCATEAEGIAFDTDVVVKPGGDAGIVPVGFVTQHAMEKVTAMALQQPHGADLRASCDMPVAMRTPIGETVRCVARGADGAEHAVGIRFDDDRGDIHIAPM